MCVCARKCYLVMMFLLRVVSMSCGLSNATSLLIARIRIGSYSVDLRFPKSVSELHEFPFVTSEEQSISYSDSKKVSDMVEPKGQ